MGKPYNITITDGVGSANVLADTYSVTSNTTGYSNESIDPKSLTVVEGTNSYEFTIAAEGTLTLHVSEDGTTTGTAVVGAKFIRCDKNGATYGDEITTNNQGNAVFNYVPFDLSNAPIIYYKQTASDGEHIFDSTLKNISLETSTKTIEIINTLPSLKTFTLSDKNYDGLAITSGSITLN